MADWTMKLYGGEQLAKNLRALPLAVMRKTLIGILRDAGEPMRARMATNAPKPQPENAPGGHIAYSMTISVARTLESVTGVRSKADEFQAAVAIGPDKDHPYGIFHEYGSVHLSARPFMRPAFDNTAAQALGAIQNAIWRALRDSVDEPRSAGGTGTL